MKFIVMHFFQTVKPKSPKNVSVQQTKNENFDISWKTIYKGPIFEELIPELTYSITGSKAKVRNLDINICTVSTKHKTIFVFLHTGDKTVE